MLLESAVLFRELLNQLRKDRGWSVQTLAERSGLPVGTVNSYCISGHGNRLPTLASAISLARALGESVSIFEGCEDFRIEDKS